MPQLDPTWFISQLFWLFLSFTALYVIMARFVLPQLVGTMIDRQKKIASDIDTAERMKNQAEQAKKDYEQALSEARARAQFVFNEAMQAQKLRMESAAREMDAKVAGMISEAQKKIEAQKKNLLDALVPASTEIANMIVDKLTQQESQKSSKVIVTDLFKGRGR